MPENTAQAGNLTPQGGTGEGAKQEFTPITTQAELDAIVGQRVARERAKYAGFDDFKAKAAKFDELQAASKTELEKAQERATKAESELSSLKIQAQRAEWNAQVATATGLPVQVVADLAASTAEELTEKAKRTAELMHVPPLPFDGRDKKTYQGAGSASDGEIFASFAAQNFFK